MSDYSVEVEIPDLPPMYNALIRMHFRLRMREREKWIYLIREAFRKKIPKTPLKTAKVTFTRYSSGSCDYDGLVGSFKLVSDALTRLKVITDDSLKILGSWEVNWEKAPRGRGKVKIKVEGNDD